MSSPVTRQIAARGGKRLHNRSRTDRLGVNGGEFRSRNAFELGPEFFGKIGKRGQMPGEDGVAQTKPPAGIDGGLWMRGNAPRGLFGSRLVDRDAGLLEMGLQLLLLEHLADDVATTNELALDVELR